MGFRYESHDRIHIRDLALRCIIGINAEERLKPQTVIIDVTLFADLQKAGKSDKIEDTVHYGAVTDYVTKTVEGSSYGLLERLAEVVAMGCFSFDGVTAVRVGVTKPDARDATLNVGVEIFREQE